MVDLPLSAAKIMTVKVGTSIDLAHLPCRPTCLVGLPALFALLKQIFSKPISLEQFTYL
jgi:hypothetical protein